MIWGGVLQRHPKLQVGFTEVGSGWVIDALEGMDYSYEGSFLRRDIRDLLELKPSEYFQRHCHLGSSLFSLAEGRARRQIGVDKIAIGVDFPHHEGTWGVGPGTATYLRATLGAAGVTRDEARSMLGGTPSTYGSSMSRNLVTSPLVSVRACAKFLLRRPEIGYACGDVNKPLVTPF
jgi:hypothetical protein